MSVIVAPKAHLISRTLTSMQMFKYYSPNKQGNMTRVEGSYEMLATVSQFKYSEQYLLRTPVSTASIEGSLSHTKTK